jgi:hypothetical protein
MRAWFAGRVELCEINSYTADDDKSRIRLNSSVLFETYSNLSIFKSPEP